MEIAKTYCLCRLSRAARRDIVEIKKRQRPDERAVDPISFEKAQLGSRKIIDQRITQNNSQSHTHHHSLSILYCAHNFRVGVLFPCFGAS